MFVCSRTRAGTGPSTLRWARRGAARVARPQRKAKADLRCLGVQRFALDERSGATGSACSESVVALSFSFLSPSTRLSHQPCDSLPTHVRALSTELALDAGRGISTTERKKETANRGEPLGVSRRVIGTAACAPSRSRVPNCSYPPPPPPRWRPTSGRNGRVTPTRRPQTRGRPTRWLA
jgi:hypothetical protein